MAKRYASYLLLEKVKITHHSGKCGQLAGPYCWGCRCLLSGKVFFASFTVGLGEYSVRGTRENENYFTVLTLSAKYLSRLHSLEKQCSFSAQSPDPFPPRAVLRVSAMGSSRSQNRFSGGFIRRSRGPWFKR